MKTRALFAALCLADMPLAQGTVTAIELVFTKNSPTDLTATFDGQPLSVFNAANNLWEGTLPSGFIFGGGNLAPFVLKALAGSVQRDAAEFARAIKEVEDAVEKLKREFARVKKIGVIRTFIGGERACSIHLEGNLPIGGLDM